LRAALAKVTVAIQRFYSGSWHTIKTATTTSTGTFSYVAADKTGKYRVTATKFTKAGTPQHICTAATSASPHAQRLILKLPR